MLTLIYYLHCYYKLLKMSWSIINRKTDKYKMSGVVVALVIIVVVFILTFFLLIQSLVYQFIICKLLKMTWYIVDRKTDKFRMSGIAIVVIITCCRYLSICLYYCLGCPLFVYIYYLCLYLGCCLLCLGLLSIPILKLFALLLIFIVYAYA